MGKYPFSSRSRASAILLFLALLFSACAEEPAEPTVTFLGPTPVGEGEAQALPFETIDRNEWAGDFWQIEEPGLQLIVAPDDTQHLDELLVKDARDQLFGLDYGNHFAIAVFLGHFSQDHGQDVEVQQVLRRGNQVALYARVHIPEPGEESRAQEISPYHVISIAKEGEWNQEIEFTLYLNGEAAVTETHFIP